MSCTCEGVCASGGLVCDLVCLYFCVCFKCVCLSCVCVSVVC